LKVFSLSIVLVVLVIFDIQEVEVLGNTPAGIVDLRVFR